MSCVIAIDYGTQSVRVSIINDKGEFLAFEQEKYDQPYFSLKPGYCEQNPDYYYNKMCIAANRLTAKNKKLIKNCSSISSTCFRDTCVLLNKDKNVIRPSIIRLDQRQAKLIKKLPFLYNLAFNFVGMGETVSVNRKRTPAIWIQENEPENWSKTKFYVPLNTYLNYRLLGILKDSASNYIGHFPINFKKGSLYGKNAIKGCIYGIDPKLMVEPSRPGEVIGKITEKCHVETGFPVGLQYIATGNDKSCEALGAGAIEEYAAHASFGTASSIAMISKKYFEPVHFLPAYCTAFEGYYSGEVQVYRGYWMLSWFLREFAHEELDTAQIEKIVPEELLNKKIMDIQPGSNGLIVQPFWGPQLDKPYGKGSIIGFYDVHTKYHVYRAIIEGIDYALKEGLESIQKRSHQKCTYITVAGGGSKSDAICQITADIFSLPVYKSSTYETSSLGCAMAQFVALKQFKDIFEAKEEMVKYEKIFYPHKEAAEKYEYLFNKVYKKIYPRLKKNYKYLNQYLQENNEGRVE